MQIANNSIPQSPRKPAKITELKDLVFVLLEKTEITRLDDPAIAPKALQQLGVARSRRKRSRQQSIYR